MAYGLLIDDEGMCWPEVHPRLSNRLRTKRTGEALASFSVRNLGFVRLLPKGTAIHLQLNPAIVSGRALTGVYQWIGDARIERGVVEPVGACEPVQFLTSRKDLLGFLGSLMERLSPRSDFAALPIPPDQSQFAGNLTLAVGIINTTMPVDIKSDLLGRVFDGRTLLSEWTPADGECRIVAVGDALERIVPGIKDNWKGRTFREALGGAYGAWITDTVTGVARSGSPTNEYVEAVVTLGRQRPRRIFYERLLVPATMPSGARQVLTVTSAA